MAKLHTRGNRKKNTTTKVALTPLQKKKKRRSKNSSKKIKRIFIILEILLVLVIFLALYVASQTSFFSFSYDSTLFLNESEGVVIKDPPPPKTLNKKAYDQGLKYLAHYIPPVISTSTATSSASSTATVVPTKPPLWPVTNAPYPKVGALLPFNRIVAYYGNFYSTQMGVLGEYDAPEMLDRLLAEVKKWEAADPQTPVIPALDYIAITAQASPGASGMYRFRMPDDQIDHALELADQINGLVFLDLQVGLSDLQTELPLLEKYLKMPNVELSLDPEFSMKRGHPPGTYIGTFDAVDINYAAQYLATLVRDYNLPPKILVVHRFTEAMVTNYKQIAPLPEVQIVIDMDGWGSPAKKKGTYSHVINSEPIQFTGFKLFYKNDAWAPSTGMMTPEEILKLTPSPSYIQYQ